MYSRCPNSVVHMPLIEASPVSFETNDFAATSSALGAFEIFLAQKGCEFKWKPKNWQVGVFDPCPSELFAVLLSQNCLLLRFWSLCFVLDLRFLGFKRIKAGSG